MDRNQGVPAALLLGAQLQPQQILPDWAVALCAPDRGPTENPLVLGYPSFRGDKLEQRNTASRASVLLCEEEDVDDWPLVQAVVVLWKLAEGRNKSLQCLNFQFDMSDSGRTHRISRQSGNPAVKAQSAKRLAKTTITGSGCGSMFRDCEWELAAVKSI